MEALENDFQVPEYLLRMLGDYLSDRNLVYETSESTRKKKITSGAAQGSVLGPEIWNISYDAILRMDMPENNFLVGYADDIAAVIIDRNSEDIQLKLNQVMRRISAWMIEHSLELATAKTKLVFLTKKHIDTLMTMTVSGIQVQAKSAAKYLGMTLDCKLNFSKHLNKVANKAATVTTSLSKIMANVKGPRQSKRKLMLQTAEAIMLYGAEVFADVLKWKTYRKCLERVQQAGALRIACSYRTVSGPAVLVVAGVIPIDLLAKERQIIYKEKEVIGKIEAREQARRNSIEVWQNTWNEELRGRWTARLIDRLEPWLIRKDGEVNYYLTQLLTARGLFLSYLYKMGKVASACCPYEDSLKDDAEHTFFHCDRWKREREELTRSIGVFTPDNLIPKMLENLKNRKKVVTYAEKILKSRKEELENM